jgi:hypothetical protein
MAISLLFLYAKTVQVTCDTFFSTHILTFNRKSLLYPQIYEMIAFPYNHPLTIIYLTITVFIQATIISFWITAVVF